MSSFFDEASLVMIPSGYKDQKVYSVKPLDGSGDLTFSRASNATRVASNGLIEKVRTNFVLHSEAIDNAAWTKAQLNTTGTPPYINVAVAPDGTLTADKIIANTSNSFHNLTQAFTLSTSGLYTASAFIKPAEESIVTIRFRSDSFVNGFFATFNLLTNSATGAFSGTGTFVSAKIEALADGWFRVVATGTIPSGSSVNLQYELRSNSFAGNNSDGLFIWGAQLETGDIATDYIATTTTAVSVGPVSGLPRLDYLNSSCPRLLLEPQRTNTLTYSEAFDNADWSKLNLSVSANTSDTLDPAGYYGADKVTDNATNAAHLAFRISQWDTTQRTASVFAKAGTSSKVYIQNASTGQGVYADLSTATIVVSPNFTGTLTAYGNGWYRITATHTAATAQTMAIGLFTGTSTASYSGTGSYAYIWGGQLEAGAYATSYIPTLGTSVTRVADAASKTGISSLIGQTEGTLFVDTNAIPAGVNQSALAITDGTTNNRIWLRFGSNNILNAVFITNNVVIGAINTSVIANNSRMKIAFGYKNSDFALYVNGVLVGSQSSGTLAPSAAFSTVGFNLFPTQQNHESPVSQALVFKTRLPNSDLATLTSL
jgi:hypothetical protein